MGTGVQSSVDLLPCLSVCLSVCLYVCPQVQPSNNHVSSVYPPCVCGCVVFDVHGYIYCRSQGLRHHMDQGQPPVLQSPGPLRRLLLQETTQPDCGLQGVLQTECLPGDSHH